MYHHGKNTLIKLLHHDETKKRAHDSQIVRAKENQVEPRWVQLQISIRHQPTEQNLPNINTGHLMTNRHAIDHMDSSKEGRSALHLP